MPIRERQIPYHPTLLDRFRSWVRLLGKYGLSSLSATALDFLLFHLTLTSLAMTAVDATIAGRCAGALLAFWLQRRWVFYDSKTTRWWSLVARYLGGVFLGMGMNVGGVWLLHDGIGWAPWPARIASALTTWIVIFLFNRYVVFHPATNRQPSHLHT